MEVAAAKAKWDYYVYGTPLTWGTDGFLGLGWGREYCPSVASYVGTTTGSLVSEPTTITLDAQPATLIPTLSQIGGLTVWLPKQKILIPTDLFAPFLPPIAPLNQRYIPIAVEILGILRQLYPSEEANAYYVQALNMLGWATQTAPQRDWYLTEAYRVQSGLGSAPLLTLEEVPAE